MKIFYILEKDSLVLALDVMGENTADEIYQLQDQGFQVVSDNIKARNAQAAINFWCAHKTTIVEEPVLTPLELANLTIRKANRRINELKHQLESARQEINLLKNKVENSSSEEFRNICHLDVLGYESQPSIQDLRKRYKSLASLYHPDKGGSKVMMQKINNAYSELRKEISKY